MTVLFSAEEKRWIDKEPMNWHIINGCPDAIREGLEKKLKELKNFGRKMDHGTANQSQKRTR